MLLQRFWRQLFAFAPEMHFWLHKQVPPRKKLPWADKVHFCSPKRVLAPLKALFPIAFLCVRRMGASWGVKVRFVMENYILERGSAIYAGFGCLGRLGALHRPQGYEFLRNYNGSEGMSPAHRNPLLSKKSDSQEVE